jgi:alkyl hydroperoxide reductase subunit D
MDLDTLRARIPDHAKDLRLNLSQLDRIETLTPDEIWGSALTAAEAAGGTETLGLLLEATRGVLSQEAITAARTAAALMAMNNVYYRFTHLVGDPTYGQLPARLRMQGLARPGVPKRVFEAYSLAASAVNGCGQCMTAHEKSMRAEGHTPEAIHDVVRIAAIIAGIARTLEAEAALAPA